MKLSICVVTMNRAAQLREALASCLACELPRDTEFVVIDNASTDDTEDVVRATLGECGYSYYYEKLPENIGAGAGRNYYYEKSTGQYVYGMDDDAIVAFDNNPDFFVKAIDILDKNSSFATLATQIYDVAWQTNRQAVRGKAIIPGVYKCKMFCGGSHFLRRSAYAVSPYLSNKYGYEELPPSLIARDLGMYNVFCPELLVIHNPIINKWKDDNKDYEQLLVIECSVPYAIKRMMYPRIFMPFIWFMYKMRCKKHLRNIKNSKLKSKEIIKKTCLFYGINYKVKIRTVVSLCLEHGVSIF